MNALSITKALRSFVFIILSLFFMTNSNAEPNSSDFNLGNKQYRCINGKWYNYLNGKQGDHEILPLLGVIKSRA